MFYMHLKYDHKLFRALFTGPLIIAALTMIGLLFLFGQLGPHRGSADARAECRCRRRRAAPAPRRRSTVAGPSFTVHWSTVIGLAASARVPAGARGSTLPGTAVDGTPPTRRATRPARPPASAPASSRRSSLHVPVAQRAAARPERLLPVQRAHGAAPHAHARSCRRCCSLGTPGWMLRAAAALAARVGRARATLTRRAVVLPRSSTSCSRSGTCRRCTTSRWRTTRCTSCST